MIGSWIARRAARQVVRGYLMSESAFSFTTLTADDENVEHRDQETREGSGQEPVRFGQGHGNLHEGVGRNQR